MKFGKDAICLDCFYGRHNACDGKIFDRSKPNKSAGTCACAARGHKTK